MQLKSLEYVLFILITVISYYSLYRVRGAQRFVILVANLFFIYSASGLFSLAVITILCTAQFLIGIQIEKAVTEGRNKAAAAFMWIGVLLPLGVLCYFKFFSRTLDVLRDYISSHGATSLLDLVMPIGLSYYTLSMIAYSVDIYHKKHEAEKNWPDFLVFITFFPSIIEGPINLYKKTAPQFKTDHAPSENNIIPGLQRCLWGYIKKVVIADRIGIVVNAILGDDNSVMFTLIWAMILFFFQMYADFSGGIDVIMGIAEILDIRLTENFRSPFVSKSVTEFWQRWHISLGEFMEKYIYYPTVLNRRMMRISKKIPSKYMQKCFSATVASIFVFILVGIWHGTGWNYVVYGCYQAFFVSTAVLLAPLYKKSKSALHINEESLSWNIFKVLRTFCILDIGMYFARAADLETAIDWLKRSFSGFKLSSIHIIFDGTLTQYGLDEKNIGLMYICILVLILVDILHDKGIRMRQLLMKQDIVFRYSVYLAGIFIIIIFGIYGYGFEKSSFIYQGF